jgi:hypothetical protein
MGPIIRCRPIHPSPAPWRAGLLWTLATNGYLPIAALLAFVLVSLVQIARRRAGA